MSAPAECGHSRPRAYVREVPAADLLLCWPQPAMCHKRHSGLVDRSVICETEQSHTTPIAGTRTFPVVASQIQAFGPRGKPTRQGAFFETPALAKVQWSAVQRRRCHATRSAGNCQPSVFIAASTGPAVHAAAKAGG